MTLNAGKALSLLRSHLTNGRAGSPLPAARVNCSAHGVTRPAIPVCGMTSSTGISRSLGLSLKLGLS